ncbi:MAG: hypothetical protein ABSC06_01845 [Rhodopila sp.]
MALPGVGSILGVVRRVDRLFENVEKTQKAIEVLETRLRAVEDRMMHMEADQELQVERAKGAASAAAGFAINTHLVTIASRLGAVEEAIRRDDQKRLT